MCIHGDPDTAYYINYYYINLSRARQLMQIHADFDPGQTLKGLSHKMDLAI
jgi:hypothetical protein